MLFQTISGSTTEFYIRYLEHKARGGAGIVTLGEILSATAAAYPGMNFTRENMNLFAEMSAAIREHGAISSVELTHGGRNARPEFNKKNPVGPMK
jgi:2,4-dienoyl-CoA reductase-like NADH-dependent reductase (Old Yellow Enzyme family)